MARRTAAAAAAGDEAPRRRCASRAAAVAGRGPRRGRRRAALALAAAVVAAAAAAGSRGGFVPGPAAPRAPAAARRQGPPVLEVDPRSTSVDDLTLVQTPPLLEGVPEGAARGEGFRRGLQGRDAWKVNTPKRALARARLAIKSEARTWVAIFCIGLAGLVGSSYLLQEQASKAGKPEWTSQVFEQWYARATEASKKANRLAQKAQETLAAGQAGTTQGATPVAKAPKSIVSRIRSVASTLDNCQNDIYTEQWRSLDTYPMVLSSYVPLFNSYIDATLPDPAPGTPDELLRKSLQFEAQRFSSGQMGFEASVAKRSIREVERSFAEMSLAYDRFLKAGNLYSGYDPVSSTEVFYQNIDDSRLVYVPPVLEQPRIRDEVLVTRGPDKGKIGQVIWLGKNGPGNPDPDRVSTAVVKMDPNPSLGLNDDLRGIREVKAYPYGWIAVTRSSDENVGLDILLGGLAALFSCALTYPLDSIKSRIQAGLPLLPSSGVGGLFSGLTFNLLREVPNQAIYMAGFNWLTQKFCLLVDANNPSLKFLVMIPAGVIGFLAGTPIRAPFEILNKQIQTGQAKTDQEAIENVFLKPKPGEIVKTLQTTLALCVVRGVPFGAFQCLFYEIFKDKWELVQFGFPLWAQPLVWGATAGALTGVLTNPPDVLLTRLSKEDAEYQKGRGPCPPDDTFERLSKAAALVQKQEGVDGFFKGAGARALYFAPEACLWFTAYEQLKGLAGYLLAEL